jgi:hypothetical protein
MARSRTKFQKVSVVNKAGAVVLRKMVGCKAAREHKQSASHTCTARRPKEA